MRDTVRNLTADTIGLRIGHGVVPGGGYVHVGDRSALDGTDAYNPWNPTRSFPSQGGAPGRGG